MKKKESFSEFISKEIIKHFILVLVTIFLSFTILIYFITNGQTKDNLKKETEEINQYIAEDFKTIENGTKNIMAENNIKKDKKDKKEIKKEFYKLRSQTELKFNFTILDNDGLITSNLYDHNLVKLQASDNLKDGINYINRDDQDTYIKINNIDYSTDQKSDIFFMVKLDSYYIIIEFLEESLKKLNKNNTIPLIITDNFDNILYQDTQSFKDSMGKVSIDTQTNIFYADVAHLFGQEILNIKVKNTKFNQQMIFLSYVLIFFISIFFLGIIPVLSNKIATSVSAPLHNFIEVIKTNKTGQLDYLIETNSFYEFELLGQQYNELLQSIQSLFDSQDELKNREKWMEIKILQEQFNPHFLYNTLESIRFEMLLDQENASKMILSLSKLMRYSIKYHESTVFLKDDIKYINDYLKLQKMRFDKRLNFHIDLPDSLLKVKVPKLLIQPIIENSIKYNMDVVDSLNLEIYGESFDAYHVIEIRDDGVGMSKEKLKELKKDLFEEKSTRNNYGLFNVHRSIQLLYGSKYGLEINDAREGFKVQIYLPRGENNV